jgi:ATP-dependent Clp protease adaptor protein ClpS
MSSVRIFFLLLSFFGMASAAFVPSSRRAPGSRMASFGVPKTLSAHRDAVTMMPATIERDAVKVGGPAVLDRPETQRKDRVDEPTKERKGIGSEAWEVRIYNDGMNTREHVARSLVQVTGMTEIGAYQTMMQAHQNGIAVIGRYVFEVAEMYHEALKKNGIVCDIVPVEEE